MSRRILALVTLTTLLITSGCASTSAVVPVDPALDLERAPAWVTEAPDAGRVMSALGTASGIEEASRLRRAARSNARQNMAAQIAERLKPVLDEKRFSLTEAGAAHARLGSGEATGKVVVDIEAS